MILGKIYCEEHEKYNAEIFHNFLNKVLTQYLEGKIVMILDNARIHHAKFLKSFLDENKERIELMLLPPYNPELNLIEGLWGWLKSSIINNVFFESIFKVKAAIGNFIENINKATTQIIDSLCVKM